MARCSLCGERFYTLPEQSMTAITSQTLRHRDAHTRQRLAG